MRWMMSLFYIVGWIERTHVKNKRGLNIIGNGCTLPNCTYIQFGANDWSITTFQFQSWFKIYHSLLRKYLYQIQHTSTCCTVYTIHGSTTPWFVIMLTHLSNQLVQIGTWNELFKECCKNSQQLSNTHTHTHWYLY